MASISLLASRGTIEGFTKLMKGTINDVTSDLARMHYKDVYKLACGVFKKDNAPKMGDRVKLRYRRTKKGHEVFDLNKARIVEVVCNE